MIFQYTLDNVLSGRKTQTSRLAKPDDRPIVGQDGRIEAVKISGREKYRVGKTYSVQPSRNAASVARIRLTGIDHKNVREVTAKEAHAEGYDSRDAFFEAWERIHGADRHDADIWLLTFELA